MDKLIALTLTTLLSAGCAQYKHPAESERTAGRVTGSIGYLQRISLSTAAVATVRLVDISRVDAGARVMGEQVIHTDDLQPPFPFSIPYDQAKIDPRYTYAVQARIEENGALRFISDRHYPVITRGAPSHIDLVLKPVNNNQ